MIYTGIGSRETPNRVLKLMAAMGQAMAEDGWKLRSGGAPGADISFERGSDVVPGSKEIFLPWISFNAVERDKLSADGVTAIVTDEALDLARRYHPAFGRLSHGARLLMARNSYQVLGPDLSTPTNMIVCWTEKGAGKGGTGQALRIARDLDIPVIDIGIYEDLAKAVDAVEEMVEILTITQ